MRTMLAYLLLALVPVAMTIWILAMIAGAVGGMTP